MTAPPPDDTTTNLHAVIAALRAERHAAVAREAKRDSDYAERAAHQGATVEVLQAMAVSPGNPKPVFEVIVRRARDLCDAYGVSLAQVVDNSIVLRAYIVADEALGKRHEAGFPRPVTGDTIFGRAILAREPVQIPDVAADETFALRESTLRGVVRALVAVPLMRDGEAIGAIDIARRQTGEFSPAQIELLQVLANQAVIAINSAETYRALQTRTADLQESLEYQTASSDVLKVISRSTFDLQPVLDTLVETAARLCEADQATIVRREGDLWRTVANIGSPPEYLAFYRSRGGSRYGPGVPSVAARAVREKAPVHIHDVAAVPGYPDASIRLGKQRTSLGVPLLREGEVIGIIVLARQRVEPFTDRHIELVATFADQAVIAIENTRLLSEQREALEQQTATAEVLQVINASPGNLAPVFDAMLEKAMRQCGGTIGGIFTFDGDHSITSAVRGVTAAFEDYNDKYPMDKIQPGTVPARIIETRGPVQSPDLTAGEAYRAGYPYARALVELGGIRAVLAVPLLKDGVAVGMVAIYRQEAGAFSDKQIALLENFAAQAVIAMENARLLTEQREALEQQTATAEVLQVINANPGNLAPVFDAILEKAHRLCGATHGGLHLFDGEKFRAVATYGISEVWAERTRDGLPAVNNPVTEPLLEGARLVHIADMVDINHPLARVAAEATGVRTALFVPLRKDNRLIGAISALRREVRPFTEKEIALLENFAAQAVIAMENARLLTETREALEQQTATAEVLGVINSNPGDLAPVFDAMLEKAHGLCGIAMGSLELYDGQRFRAVAVRGLSDAFADMLRQGYPASENPATGPLIDGGRLTHIRDLAETDYAITRSGAELDAGRTLLCVPLRREGTLLGMIASGRKEVRPFSDKEIALLENFAAQAVIAMENARLITETREALEQQTATAEVLQVINASPGDLAPVFDAMLEKAMRLCGAAYGVLRSFDGKVVRILGSHGVPPAYAEFLARNAGTPAQGSGVLRALQTGRPAQTLDATESVGYKSGAPGGRAIADLGGARTVLHVPLVKDQVSVGLFTFYRREVRGFSDKQIALLENFAAQAVIAMENARLLDEIRQRQEELRITFENMGDGVAMFDETQYLAAWNHKFQDILDLPDALLGQRRTYEEHLRFLAARGDFGPGVDTVEQIEELVASTGQPYGYERTRPDGRVIEIRRNPVPDGGFVLIYSDITERKRSEEEIRAARDAAETALRELKTAQANLIQAEKMASLGQLTAGIAHEIKNPLNFVNNFAALSVDLLSELKETAAPGFATLTEKQRAEVEDVSAMLTSNLEKITEHGKRADGIVKAMLEHSRGSSGERRMVDLNALIDEALNLAYHGARAQDQTFNITLERDFGEGIAPIEVNPQDMTRVFLNIFSNGFYAATRRARNDGNTGFVPTLKVATRDADGAVEISVRDNGTGIPTDIRDKLFQPFFTTKPTGEGTGLGLSITYDIVTQQHGGTITVESEVGEYSEFAIRLPRHP